MAKKLLSEAQVRRFAKLANLSPINEMYSKRDEKEEELEENRGHMSSGHSKKRDEEEKEKTIAQESPVKTSLTYETGAKQGQRVMRGSRGRRALYTSNRGGVGFRSPLSGGGMYG